MHYELLLVLLRTKQVTLKMNKPFLDEKKGGRGGSSAHYFVFLFFFYIISVS